MVVRTRFAPSPTGYLHIGGARTALYAYLYAKRYSGQFILRIEDTDIERSTPQAVQAILDGMNWLGLTYDEGPYYQTERFDRYREIAEKLLTAGKAYRCYCSKERLESLRAEQNENRQKPRYDGHCRHLSSSSENKDYVIRFANPENGHLTFNDSVHGMITIDNQELDDLIIMRSDHTPTYNFTVVVDDADMQISHVIRGDDHLNNTPRQIHILQALNAKIPHYAHLPMILDSDGKKLSKRTGAASVMQYRDEGYLPQALLNYLIRLGWSHGDQEIFSMTDMCALFDLDHLNKSPAALNISKLAWLNQHYLKTAQATEVLPELQWHLQQLNIKATEQPNLSDIFLLQRERCKTLKEIAERSQFFYQTESSELPPITAKPALVYFYQQLNALSDWTRAAIHQALQITLEQLAIKMNGLAPYVRLAITGTTVSPPLDETLCLLGKNETLLRLKKVIDSLG